MKSLWRPISITVGLACAVAGTLLLMGNIRHYRSQADSVEFNKLHGMAAIWEAGLECSRSMVREQILRDNLLRIATRPGEWASWRAAQSYEQTIKGWNSTYGAPKSIALLVGRDQFHSFSGDTNGLAIAIRQFDRNASNEIEIYGGDANCPAFIAILYKVQQDSASQPARFLALFDPATVLSVGDHSPRIWTLLGSPNTVMFSSSSGTQAAHVSEATWPLLLKQKSGTLPGNTGEQWGFASIQLPGLSPVLLLGLLTNPPAAHSAAIALLIFAFLLTAVAAVVPARGPSAAANPDTVAAPAEDPAGSENTSYRQIFQTIPDPLCVVDVDGRVLRANHSAKELFRLNKGRPDPTLVTKIENESIPVAALLQQIVAGAANNTSHYNFTASGETVFSGQIHAVRLYVEKEHNTPWLIQLIAAAESASLKTTASTYGAAIADSMAPHTVIVCSSDGLVLSFNEAARAACPAVDSSPLVADLLVNLEPSDLKRILTGENDARIETLFGGKPFEFRVRAQADARILYGYPAASSKVLEIELAQSLENFNTLCNMTPAAVLLLNVHDHTIRQCNIEACDLFGIPAPMLTGRTLESLSSFGWEPSSDPEQEFFATTPDGRTIRCAFSCEVVKVEGEPTMLAVLNPIMTYQPVSESENETQQLLAIPQTGPTPSILSAQEGPGLLIVSNPMVRDVARRLLERAGQEMESFTSLDDATVWIITHDVQPRLVALDVTDFDRVDEWLTDLRTRRGNVPCLAISDEEEVFLPNSGGNYFLRKPFDLDAIEVALRELNVEATAEA